MNLAEKIKKGESQTLEFKQKLSKELPKIVTAFANSLGGEVLIGVDDTGEIIGLDKKINCKEEIAQSLQALIPLPSYQINEINIDNKLIIILKVNPAKSIISYRNIAYIRNQAINHQLSINEVIEKAGESLLLAFDRQISKINIKETNEQKFQQYLSERHSKRGVSQNNNLNNLEVLGFAKGEYLTNAGILLFTDHPQQFLPNANLRIVLFSGNDRENYTERKEVSGDLLSQVQQVESFLLEKFSTISGPRVGFKKLSYSSYPVVAVREALLNAIIHRNYFDEGDIRVFLYKNKLEIINPGSFPPGVSLEKPNHRPRNPLLAQYFYDIGYVEKYGSGLSKIQSEVKKHPFVDVEFELVPYATTVKFKQDLSLITLDEVDNKIIEFLTLNPKSSGELAKLVNLSRQAVLARIKDLISLGIVVKKENLNGKALKYKIIENTTSE